MRHYDAAGNITGYLTYDYSLSYNYMLTPGTGVQPTSVVWNTYGNSNWGDLLTQHGSAAYSYDAIGNLLSDGTWTFTWAHGRQLTSMSNGTNTFTYTYNADGLRSSKTVLGVHRKYYYNGDKLVRETWGSHTAQYFYDASGIYAMQYDGAMYYYIKNLQGDVLRMVDASGNVVATYVYDAWGKVLYSAGSMAGVNSFRYRGYYYDGETGLYYLQSRYYDPEVGRFINADAFASTGQGILGNNMFAYCGNNPVFRRDDSGTYYTPGQIHDFVVHDICKNNPNKTGDDTYISYYSPILKGKKWYTYGFCDIYDTETHEVWEVKRLGGGSTCSPAAAGIQLANYVLRGFLKHHDSWLLKQGGTDTYIEPNMFTKTDSDGQGMYVIGYFDAGNGLVFYDYFYIPSPGEAVTVACAVIGMYALFYGVGFVSSGTVPVFG